ncbi:MAG: succinate dehydrogenase cytochrome b subunit [Thermoanaerobaculia bacterium]|nr:succinate dehydrogenase cytochrome b subunit [Thermoanaerobaculia bacterium]
MSWLFDFYRSALGKKAVMAVTGIVLFGFVFMHMVGNLKLYMGCDDHGVPKINVYAEGLREIGAPILGHGQALWIARLGLLAAVGLHMLSAYQLTMINRRARPGQGYARFTPQASTYASRTLRWGGVILLLFIVYHLMHLTLGNVHSDFVAGDVFRNVVVGFSNPLVSGFYIVAQVALGFHLYHGLWSLFQSLGWNGPRLNTFRQRFAAAFAIIVSVANISFPLAVLAGFVKLGA